MVYVVVMVVNPVGQMLVYEVTITVVIVSGCVEEGTGVTEGVPVMKIVVVGSTLPGVLGVLVDWILVGALGVLRTWLLVVDGIPVECSIGVDFSVGEELNRVLPLDAGVGITKIVDVSVGVPLGVTLLPVGDGFPELLGAAPCEEEAIPVVLELYGVLEGMTNELEAAEELRTEDLEVVELD